ncbi:unnamed protein product [Paramecium pentaurelia]|uniref:Uncharacterized protein n=1 Tax=Paramecium pentaurelia TaxID=43138 RepID=A0A8S1VA88_9CILI|nr:unnamed protein product [Paramecium pentaurelia]
MILQLQKQFKNCILMPISKKIKIQKVSQVQMFSRINIILNFNIQHFQIHSQQYQNHKYLYHLLIAGMQKNLYLKLTQFRFITYYFQAILVKFAFFKNKQLDGSVLIHYNHQAIVIQLNNYVQILRKIIKQFIQVLDIVDHPLFQFIEKNREINKFNGQQNKEQVKKME